MHGTTLGPVGNANRAHTSPAKHHGNACDACTTAGTVNIAAYWIWDQSSSLNTVNVFASGAGLSPTREFEEHCPW